MIGKERVWGSNPYSYNPKVPGNDFVLSSSAPRELGAHLSSNTQARAVESAVTCLHSLVNYKCLVRGLP